MKLFKNQSVSDLENEFLEYKKNQKEDIFDYMKQYSDNQAINNGDNYAKNQDLIDYIQKGDCLLMIKKNKLKVIKRENNGLFDLTNFIELNNNKIKGAKCVIYDKDDLEYLLKNLDIRAYISYYPSIKKIKVLSKFLQSLKI